MSIIDDFKYAFRKPNNGLIQIILINVIVFVALLIFNWVAPKDIYETVYRQLFLPAPIMEFLMKPWTLLTYFFTHSDHDFFHILFNMLFLFWFGKLLDEYLGNRRLVNIYFLGAISGAVLYLIAYNTIPYFIRLQPAWGMVGASAAVYAVVVGAATLMPNYTFFLFLLGPVKIKYIAAFYIILSILQSVGPNAGGNIAHLGGALIGYIYVIQLKKGNDLATPFRRLWSSFKNIFKRNSKIHVTYRKDAGSAEYPSEDEVDRILDKINRSGYESLTKDEKQILFQFSQKN